ncbi:hypothetical protein DBR06_SOUSAS5510072, partial [Sousa chinensis]
VACSLLTRLGSFHFIGYLVSSLLKRGQKYGSHSLQRLCEAKRKSYGLCVTSKVKAA